MKVDAAEMKQRVEEWMAYMPFLGLAHWQITVEINDAPDGNFGSNACVTPHADYEYAHLQFRREFLEEHEEWDEIDMVIIHELLHMVLRNFDGLHDNIGTQLNPPVRHLFMSQINHELENVIERIAQAMWALYSPEVVS